VIGDIALCLEPEALATADAAVAAELRNSAIRWLPVGRSPAETVGLALRELREALPVLVTTADHPLLTPVMVEHFCRAAPATADVAIGLATDAVIRTQHPQSVRSYYRFGGIGYSGCNLFLLRTGAAERAAAFWQAMERHRKRPWRLALAIGPLTLCRFWMGRLSLEAALGRLSRLAGARIVALELPFAEAAIDVDKPVDLALAEAILARRPPLA
jgi:CTP:molybdopterin cytidylyltransferase MocA